MTFTNNSAGNGVAPTWHAGFLPLVPVIRQHARTVFRHLSRQDRDEALAEVTAVALMGYLGNYENTAEGPADPAVLARFATRHVLNSGRACGRESRSDVLSPTAQHQRRVYSQTPQAVLARRNGSG